MMANAAFGMRRSHRMIIILDLFEQLIIIEF